ncbi:putative peroxidase-related enzyme [Silvibacterium bohemicum]|uniref:Putative peroxidase-related enzyme n=1 Tax=Silvibacterium bohemicum TaxID=1577686 RepID=A0A841JY26_9BACT|nr:carboxymuconolactone decarboxylase family protein [Silvibacterium bohemicum]MBB6146050.1 putative peroxidase-related enzyme [Silvibacterium bohemicum]
MSRLSAIQPDQATGKAKELLDAVHSAMKMTPNMTRVMANSPAVLQGYLSFSGALAGGVLNHKLREELALAVSEQNSCQYCVSAHTAIGKMVGLSGAEIEAARDGDSASPKTAAALKFAREIVAKQGRASESDVEAVRAAGFNDGEIAEIIAHVALNVFTNYFNNTADVDVDFPKIALRQQAATATA